LRQCKEASPWALLVAAVAGALMVLAVQRLLLLSGHREAQSVDAVATVDGQPITVRAFEYEMARRGGGPAAFADLERRRALLDDMLRVDVLAANARKAGFAAEPDFTRDVTYLLAGRYRQRYIDPELTKISVSDAEVRSYYEQNRERFAIPEARHAALIYFDYEQTAPEEVKREVAERAAKVRSEAEAQHEATDFGALAVRNSADQASRYRGGDIGWLAKGQEDESRFDARVTDTIFALSSPGELSPLITTSTGIFLIRLLEIKPASMRPLAKVADGIRQQLLAEKRQRRAEELYAAASANVRVEINERRLAAMVIPTPAGTMPPKRPPPLPQE
jgi:hypothetical protein